MESRVTRIDPPSWYSSRLGYWPDLERFTHGYYVNDANPDTTGAGLQGAYRQNHDRLVRIKNQYDPTNLFRLNANIQPTVGTTETSGT